MTSMAPGTLRPRRAKRSPAAASILPRTDVTRLLVERGGQCRAVARGRRQKLLRRRQEGIGFAGGRLLDAKAVEHRRVGRILRGEDRERHRGRDEGDRERPGQLAERGGRPARRDRAAATAAHAEPAPLGALQEHDADQAEREDKVDDEDDVFHWRAFGRCWRATYSLGAPAASLGGPSARRAPAAPVSFRLDAAGKAGEARRRRSAPDPRGGRGLFRFRSSRRPDISARVSSGRAGMANVVVVGAQWGDEGKGKIVDWLSERADVICRFQGGHNAGHTLVIDGRTYKLHALPSGVVRGGKLSVIGNGVVLDPWHLTEEIETIRAQGVVITPDTLMIAENTPLILPFHGELDRAREGQSTVAKIGTTGRGIGPAYEDKVGRRVIRVADLADEATLTLRVDRALVHHNALRLGLGLDPVDRDGLIALLEEVAPKILPFAAPA